MRSTLGSDYLRRDAGVRPASSQSKRIERFSWLPTISSSSAPGTGGYVWRGCARAAAQLGMHEVAVVGKERDDWPGHCSMSAACPSKALSMPTTCSGGQGTRLRNGVAYRTPKLDLPSRMNFKQQGSAANVQGVEFLMREYTDRCPDGARGEKFSAPGKVEVRRRPARPDR